MQCKLLLVLFIYYYSDIWDNALVAMESELKEGNVDCEDSWMGSKALMSILSSGMKDWIIGM